MWGSKFEFMASELSKQTFDLLYYKAWWERHSWKIPHQPTEHTARTQLDGFVALRTVSDQIFTLQSEDL